jgi:hypothetical protein
MKTKICSLLCLALALPLGAKAADASAADTPAAVSEAKPQLRGLLVADGERQFSLVTPGRVSPTWVKLGGKFDGWELADFKPTEEALVLKKEGRTLVLKMEASSVADARPAGSKATLADAEAVLQKMDFDRMMSRVLDQQKKAVVGMTKQMSQRMGATSADAEEFAAFQKKAMDVMFEAMNLEGMKGDMAKIYSDVFSKEELQGIAEFYSTSAGQALADKQPEISQKMNEILMPRMMAAIPKVQALAGEFAQKQAAKAEAKEAEAPAPKE